VTLIFFLAPRNVIEVYTSKNTRVEFIFISLEIRVTEGRMLYDTYVRDILSAARIPEYLIVSAIFFKKFDHGHLYYVDIKYLLQ